MTAKNVKTLASVAIEYGQTFAPKIGEAITESLQGAQSYMTIAHELGAGMKAATKTFNVCTLERFDAEVWPEIEKMIREHVAEGYADIKNCVSRAKLACHAGLNGIAFPTNKAGGALGINAARKALNDKLVESGAKPKDARKPRASKENEGDAADNIQKLAQGKEAFATVNWGPEARAAFLYILKNADLEKAFLATMKQMVKDHKAANGIDD